MRKSPARPLQFPGMRLGTLSLCFWCAGVTAGLAVYAALVPTDPAAVERVYSTGIYPAVQRVVTGATNALSLAVLDIGVAVALVVVPTGLFIAARASWRLRQIRPLRHALAWLVTAASTVYLVFLGAWGLNYRRLPMEARLLMERPAPGTDEVVRLGAMAVRQLNALHGEAHEEGWNGDEWRDVRLRPAFAEVQGVLSDGPRAVPGRLKETLFGFYFRWTSVDGMVNPFGLEVVANPDLLPFERPFVAAHEWAHLAGYANEAEANFVGWLTCIRASPGAQYSGWLYLYWQVSGELGEQERASLWGQMNRGPQRDVQAIVDRLDRGQLPLLRRASLLMYDQYLKANRVDAGIRSYGEVVTLILRARFEDGWVPVRRP